VAPGETVANGVGVVVARALPHMARPVALRIAVRDVALLLAPLDADLRLDRIAGECGRRDQAGRNDKDRAQHRIPPCSRHGHSTRRATVVQAGGQADVSVPAVLSPLGGKQASDTIEGARLLPA